MTSALQVLHDLKIMIVKEEGDMSAVNQPYDQNIAKCDKRKIRELLDLYRFTLKIITQPDLIVICIKALKNISPELWISSFKKVNLHPYYCIPFLDWIKKLMRRLLQVNTSFTNTTTASSKPCQASGSV